MHKFSPRVLSMLTAIAALMSAGAANRSGW